jgi:ferredoxin-type protein NapG
MAQREGINRRSFLVGLLKGAATAAVGGVVWGGFVEATKSAPLLLRPPGAAPEADFLGTCIRCGLCVEACPYETLSLATPGAAGSAGLPSFTPRDVPCYLCQDIPCTAACPSGALDVALVSDDAGALDINRSRMGLAVMDYKNCIAAWGLRCDACYRVCPLIDKAITIEMTRNERTGRHAVLLPKVDPDHCTGCGLCEHACVVEKAAIFVLPLDVAQGRVGNDYVRGWDAEDEKRIDGSGTKSRTTGDPLDYLNDGGLLDD